MATVIRLKGPRQGEIIFNAAVDGLVELVQEIKDWPIEERRDQHSNQVQKQIRR